MLKTTALFLFAVQFAILSPCFAQERNEIPYAEFSPDGTLLLTHDHLHYRLFNAQSGQFMYEIPTGFVKPAEAKVPLGGVVLNFAIRNDAKFSPDGSSILVAYLNTIVIWDVASRKIITRIKNCELESFNGDRSHFVGLNGSLTTIRETKTGKTIYKLKAAGNMRLSPDGTTLATSQSSPPDNKIKLIDVSTGKERKLLSTTHAYHTVIRFSPNGNVLLTAAQGDSEEDRILLLWDPSSGNLIDSIPGNLYLPAFSEDGNKLVTLSGFPNDELPSGVSITANVWDVTARKQIFTLKQSQSIRTARFSPNGRRIITASEDATAAVWDSNDGTKLYTLEGHTGPVEVTAFDRQGKYVTTASEDPDH